MDNFVKGKRVNEIRSTAPKKRINVGQKEVFANISAIGANTSVIT